MNAKKNPSHSTVRLLNAAGSIVVDPDRIERIIVRGDLDLECLEANVAAPDGVANLGMLGALVIPAYQREVLGGDKQTDLRKLLRVGDVPAVEYGARGNDVDLVQVTPTTYEVTGPVVIIDGLQRTVAMRAVLLERQEIIERNKRLKLKSGDADYQDPPTLRLGVTLHIGTDEPGERDMFHMYNKRQTRMSPNVLLRNKIGDNVVIGAIAAIVDRPDFALRDRVQWGQRPRSGELVSARTLVMVMARLYDIASPDTERVLEQLDDVVERIGLANFTQNMEQFFSIIDVSWSFATTTRRAGTPQISEQFLVALARLFAKYSEFWKSDQLVINRRLLEKLGKFRLDTDVLDAVKNRNGSVSLYRWLEEHMNKMRALTPRGQD